MPKVIALPSKKYLASTRLMDAIEDDTECFRLGEDAAAVTERIAQRCVDFLDEFRKEKV